MAADPEAAWHARASGDAELAALVTEVAFGWPEDTLSKPDYPRVTALLVSGVPVRSQWEDVRIQVDAWVWPHEPGESDTGKTRVRAIDVRMVALFHEVQWLDADGDRFYASCGAARDWPSAPNTPMRRTRTITVRRLSGVSE